MSILIKGMELPNNCAECPVNMNVCGYGYKYLLEHMELYDQRADACPIVEVPKHGRLIDADAFDKTLKDGEEKARERKAYIFEGILNTIRGNLANVPTIIEAEE